MMPRATMAAPDDGDDDVSISVHNFCAILKGFIG